MLPACPSCLSLLRLVEACSVSPLFRPCPPNPHTSGTHAHMHQHDPPNTHARVTTPPPRHSMPNERLLVDVPSQQASPAPGPSRPRVARVRIAARRPRWERWERPCRSQRAEMGCARHTAIAIAAPECCKWRPHAKPPRAEAGVCHQRSQTTAVKTQVSSSPRASPLHRPRADGLAHPVETSRTNLAAALGLLSSWRLSKPWRLDLSSC